MAFIDHVRACNAHDLSGFRPLTVDGVLVGWMRPSLIADLVAADLGFALSPGQGEPGQGLTFAPGVADFDARSAAFARAADFLTRRGDIAGLRNEFYPATARWGAPPFARIDRAAVTHFGLPAFGVHVNGFVRRADGDLALWVARRSRNRAVAPGKLDNMVAGGQPFGLSLRENLLKEAAEEAGIAPALASQARPVGMVSYIMEKPAGLKRDVLFIYDLEVPADFAPRNTDGEVECFMLWPAAQAAAGVRDGSEWKFNVNLVVIDFLIRHGLIDADSEPGYLELVQGLRGQGLRG